MESANLPAIRYWNSRAGLGKGKVCDGHGQGDLTSHEQVLGEIAMRLRNISLLTSVSFAAVAGADS